MKALVCRAISEDISTVRVEDLPVREPGPGEVRLRIRAASVNFPDILMIQGKYQHKPPLPFTPGMEGAGEVVAVGEGVTRFRAGDRVVGGLRTGGFAEEAVAAESALRAIPKGMDFSAAAAFPAAYLTAYVALVRRAAIETGETLLVHGAAGGVGLAAVDLGLAFGARVIATASSEEKRAFLAARGAHLVLPSTGFREAVKDFTGGLGADVIYDPVGGDVFDESVRCIAFDGRLLVIGFTSGRIPEISVNMPLIKGFSVVGVRAGEYGRRFPARGRENLEAIDQLAEEGIIRPHVFATFPLERAVEAMRMLQERKVIGKVVVTP
ncbi:MAG: NADPH:quinone oxidoreductase family protein [Alphaproteobacteria bacterium]|nr:NADPH:quinone oxidoreductase family protein [Alphaproteobacteria bacterium]